MIPFLAFSLGFLAGVVVTCLTDHAYMRRRAEEMEKKVEADMRYITTVVNNNEVEYRNISRLFKDLRDCDTCKRFREPEGEE